MKKLNTIESKQTLQSFLSKLKKDISKSDGLVEFFELTLQEPQYLKHNCAYVQTSDKKEGLLYDAAGRHLFYIKEEVVNKKENKYLPVLQSLDFSVLEVLPKAVRENMFWVCGNKKDNPLKIEDFGVQFSLSKPTN